MQIVRGGKFSWVHDLLIICGKTFAIVQQFETPYNERKNSQENLHDWRLIRKFSTTNDLYYTVYSTIIICMYSSSCNKGRIT